MPVTFCSPAYANATMLNDPAVHRLKLMGHSAAVRGALGEEDVEPALERLEAAVEAGERRQRRGTAGYGDDSEEGVSLSQRAWRLVQLLEAASKEEVYVMRAVNDQLSTRVRHALRSSIANHALETPAIDGRHYITTVVRMDLGTNNSCVPIMEGDNPKGHRECRRLAHHTLRGGIRHRRRGVAWSGRQAPSPGEPEEYPVRDKTPDRSPVRRSGRRKR